MRMDNKEIERAIQTASISVARLRNSLAAYPKLYRRVNRLQRVLNSVRTDLQDKGTKVISSTS